MRSLRMISMDILSTGELKGLVETYQEVAAGKMQTIRTNTIETREFTEGLAALSAAVGSDLAEAVAGRKPKIAAVWMSANTGLFGDIIEKTLEMFLEFIKKENADPFIIGDAGWQLIHALAPTLQVKRISFPDDRIEDDALQDLVKEIEGYEQIVLFFGKFKSIAVQHPDQRIVSGEMLPDVQGFLDEKERHHRELIHIYEPTTTSVSRYIAEEIEGSIIEQTIYESMLAKYASRLMHLDESMDHISDHMTKLMTEKRSVKKIRSDRKQRVMLAGMRARGGTV